MDKKIIGLKNIYTGDIIAVSEYENALGSQPSGLGVISSIGMDEDTYQNVFEIRSEPARYRNTSTRKIVNLKLVTHLDRNNYDPIYLEKETIEDD